MSALNNLYQQQILDHSRHPRNFGELPQASSCAHGDNPLCGDRVQVCVLVREAMVTRVQFQGVGCAISTASASMMTTALEGKTLAEAMAMIDSFEALVSTSGQPAEALGDLVAFEGLREFPTRIKCATLPWYTARAALTAQSDVVSTE